MATIEIPLSAFGADVDLTQVTGVTMYSYDQSTCSAPTPTATRSLTTRLRPC